MTSTNSVSESLRFGYNNSVNSGNTIGWYAGDTITKTSEITGGLDGSTNGYTAISGFQQGVGYKEVMRIIGTGNVGIGTTAPVYPLDVYDGDIRSVSNTIFPAFIAQSGNTNATPPIFIMQGATSNGTAYATSGNWLGSIDLMG